MSEKLCLQWNDFKDVVNTAFGNLRGDTDFIDATLACEDGRQLKAHKVVLAAMSPFFQEILKRNQHPHPLIYLRGLKLDDLKAILDFLYCGEANVFQENLDSFLAIAEEFQLKGLMGQNHDDSIEKKIAAPTNFKPKLFQDRTILNPNESDIRIFNRKDKATKGSERSLAVTTSFSVEGLSQEELSDKVKSFMEMTQNRTQNAYNNGKLYTCKVCGKEGQSGDVQKHIEANHLEGISIPCDMCEKTARSRRELTEHKRRYHTSKL